MTETPSGIPSGVSACFFWQNCQRTGARYELHGQSFSASGPARLDDVPATPGPHPDTKTVLAFSFYFAWLVCAFHCRVIKPGLRRGPNKGAL